MEVNQPCLHGAAYEAKYIIVAAIIIRVNEQLVKAKKNKEDPGKSPNTFIKPIVYLSLLFIVQISCHYSAAFFSSIKKSLTEI